MILIQKTQRAAETLTTTLFTYLPLSPMAYQNAAFLKRVISKRRVIAWSRRATA
jgi:hypothetical protein